MKLFNWILKKCSSLPGENKFKGKTWCWLNNCVISFAVTIIASYFTDFDDLWVDLFFSLFQFLQWNNNDSLIIDIIGRWCLWVWRSTALLQTKLSIFFSLFVFAVDQEFDSFVVFGIFSWRKLNLLIWQRLYRKLRSLNMA